MKKEEQSEIEKGNGSAILGKGEAKETYNLFVLARINVHGWEGYSEKGRKRRRRKQETQKKEKGIVIGYY